VFIFNEYTLNVTIGILVNMDMFQKIVKWNEERGLIEKGFNHQKEISFIIEELLESTGAYDSDTAREKALSYAEEITQHGQGNDENLVDAFSDIIVYATGAIAKIGYDPSKVMDEVYQEINSRTGTFIDGKFVKDQNVQIYKADLSSCKF